MLEHQRNQLYVALHIDVVLNLLILSIFLFVKNYNFFAFLVILFCPIYAYGAFKRNSLINHWVSRKMDYIDTIFMKWILKSKNRTGKIFFRKFLPHNDLNIIFDDLPMPIDSSQFKKKRKKQKPEDLWNKISQEDSDPFHVNKTTLDLAQQFIENKKPLTQKELKRLFSESSYKERELLETHLSPDHPILLKIDEKLKIELSDGSTILK